MARANGAPVAYTNDAHVAEDIEMGIWGAHAMKGTEGGQVYAAVAPLEGDLEYLKQVAGAQVVGVDEAIALLAEK